MMTSFLFRAMDARAGIFLALLTAVILLVPAGNLLVPEDSPFHVPTYAVALMGKYLTYALLALSVDLVWGFCGILSLGHAAFFALGGYAMGMYLMRQIGSRGVYGDPILPDFMVFLNWDALPWFWFGFDMFWFAALMVVLVPGALAFVFGYALSSLPLLRSGISVGQALRLVLAADTVSILTMEVVDNLVMWLVPGAMNAHFDDWLYWATLRAQYDAGLLDALFWGSMALSLVIAFFAAYPVNKALLRRGKGHAITHHASGGGPMDNRPLAYGISAFMLGGFVASFGTLL